MPIVVLDASLPSEVEFIQYHWPAIPDGEYKITVSQKVQTKEKEHKLIDDNLIVNSLYVVVTGERFAQLQDQKDVFAAFPTRDSDGDHSNVLPHLTLNRSTLPWERFAVTLDGSVTESQAKQYPWLALILFHGPVETPTPKIITLKDLHDTIISSNQQIKFPQFNYDPDQTDNDKVNVIDVPYGLVKQILPDVEDLPYLAHVRQGKDDQGNVSVSEVATLICNRLPLFGGKSTAHLISLEERFSDLGDGIKFNSQNATDTDLIRFVSLYSWSFSCLADSFEQDITSLNRDPAGFQLPLTQNPTIDKYLSAGCVPLPHHLRDGKKTVSWYHSPLIPGHNQEAITQVNPHIVTADELLRYDPSVGMFDITYAAAWELGCWLTLKNTQVATSIFNWKRDIIHDRHQQQFPNRQLPINYQQISTEPPELVLAWLTDMSILKQVPFNYLIPNEQLSPNESIRFFWVDNLWVQYLMMGALSIGRVYDPEDMSDHLVHLLPEDLLPQALTPLTGVLIRSSAVTHFPDIRIRGYSQIFADEKPHTEVLPMIRMDRLGTGLLFCLFQGELKTLDVTRKPETMHFGLDLIEQQPSGQSVSYRKDLRNQQGEEDINLHITPLPWKSSENLVVDVRELADQISKKVPPKNSFTSAHFALQMIEGTANIRFIQA